MELKTKTAAIIGASSGIGAALARRLGRQGWELALVARSVDKLEDLARDIDTRAKRNLARVYAHDVTDYESVPDLFDRIVEDLGGLELIVYSAGVMPPVEPDEYNFDKDRQMVEVNLLGMMAWFNQAADFCARVQQGTIVGIGSVAGDRGRPGQPGYNTSKGAQAIFLEALRNRLARFPRVRVVTVKPGPVDTPMTVGIDAGMMISADSAAEMIERAALRSRTTAYVPRRWAPIMFVIRNIPSFIFRKLNI